MTDFADFVKSQSTGKQHDRPKHPSGWDPGVETCGDTATAISEPLDTPNANEQDLIAGWLLDPGEWRIVGNVNCRRWQTTRDGESVWLYYYKADLQRIDPAVAADTANLYRLIRSRKRPVLPPAGESTFLVLIGDTQIGKGDGDGSEGTVARWLCSLEAQVAQCLRVKPAAVVVAFMGDLREGCVGNYPAQKFSTDLTVTQQDAVLQELVFKTVDRFAQLTTDLTVAAVPGNHGEERDNGKAYTLASDNHDVAVIQTVQRGIRLNGNAAFDHVRFVYPDSEDLTVALELSGVPVGFAHGHQFPTGGTAAQKAEKWWKDQAHNKTRVGDCDILFTAHYHHLLVGQSGRKTHIQIPALDGGSTWWTNKTGQHSPPGMVSVVVGDGWDQLHIR